MKKAVIAVLVCVLLLSAACALAAVPDKPDTFADAYVYNFNENITYSFSQIEKYGQILEEKTGIKMIAVMVKSFDSMKPAAYMAELMDTWSIGNEYEDYAVILFSKPERNVQFQDSPSIKRIMSSEKRRVLYYDKLRSIENDNYISVHEVESMYMDICRFYVEQKGGEWPSDIDSDNGQEIEQNSSQDSLQDLLENIGLMVWLYCFIGFFVHSALIRSEHDDGWLRMLFPKWLFKVISAMVGVIVVGFLLAPFAALLGGAINDNSSDNDSSRSSDGSRGGGSGFGGGESRGGGGGRSF